MSESPPPLGVGPSEPRPGKESLRDPQGREAAAADGDGVCPDCGLPYRDHPDFAAGGHPVPSHGRLHATTSGSGFAAQRRDDRFDPRDAPGSPGEREQRLPGEELDPDMLGGDPAEP